MYIKIFQNHNSAFTLAEVLITLVIIGVIAAFTIPTLINNTQKQEFVNGVKKANSTLQQAMANMANKNDAAVGDYSFLSNINFIDEFAKVTNTIKKCSSVSDCFGSNYNSKYKNLSGGAPGLSTGTGVITADGVIYYYSSSLNAAGHGIDPADYAYSLGWIAVDVNGNANPNIWGRDLFLFELLSLFFH